MLYGMPSLLLDRSPVGLSCFVDGNPRRAAWKSLCDSLIAAIWAVCAQMERRDLRGGHWMAIASPEKARLCPLCAEVLDSLPRKRVDFA